MNVLQINITPSDYSNDHQVEIRIDNKNCIEGFLGIDPVVFFEQTALFKSGELIIGRCECGEVGCGSKIAKVQIDENHVYWEILGEKKYIFDKEKYLNYLEEKKNDKNWENLNRRVERLVGIEFKNTTYKKKYFFDWASCRIREEENKIFLSYSLKKPKEGEIHQEMLTFPWNRIDEDDAIKNAKIFKLEHNDID